MKDKILNLLMLVTVAAALILTLVRGTPVEGERIDPLAAAVTAHPTMHPVDAYRQRRADERQWEEKTLLALLGQEGLTEENRTAAEEQLRQTAADNEIELTAEAALAALGYDRALCVCREGKITVFAGKALEKQDAQLLLDLMAETAGISSENIRVSIY